MARILIVEDSATSMLLFREVLRRAGHEVTEATTVPEARARLDEGLPDLVLLDVHVPGGGGETLLAEIRGDPERRHMVVVAVTASVMPGDRTRLIEIGCDDYCSKPIEVRRFPEQVLGWLAMRER